MSATKAIAKLLKLHSILKIAGVRFRRDGALMLEVKPFKNGARCPQCGRRGRRVPVVLEPASGETCRWRVERSHWATPARDRVPHPRSNRGGDPLGRASRAGGRR